MSDLISRSALIEYLEKVTVTEGITFETGFKQILTDIKNQPTVEAKPVVHGEWKYDWLGEYICSNCYERVTVKEVMGEPAWDWCPACGARMVKDNE